jgi:hypothetical protein
MFRRERHKSKRKLDHKEIQKLFGDKYEHYVAELMRQDGWEVFERGVFGYDDQGIDLSATRNGAVCYVQCKAYGHDRFGHEKLVHENVVDQLYGSVAYQVGIDKVASVELYIYSSATPTETAGRHAAKLGVQILFVPIPPDWVQDDYYA